MIRRILLIAKRDYLTAVLTKAYLFGLIILPVMIGASLLGVTVLNRGNAKDQHVALIDRTGIAGARVIQAAEERNHALMFEPATGRQIMGRYIFEQIEPDPDQPAQLLSLSRRIRKGELLLLVDIASGALHPKEKSRQDLVRIYTNSAALDNSNAWLSAAVNDGLRRARLTQLGVDAAQLPDALSDVALTPMSLVAEDAKTGKIEQGGKRNPFESVLLPVFMMVLLMMIVLMGSAQKLGAIAEDKMQRVFEMLLSSASPFELMMGKVLSAVGISLTSSVFYIAGGLLAMAGLAAFGLAPLHLLPWFFVYLIADVLMLAAMGAALGASCGTPQDAQSLVMFVFAPVMIPMFALTPVMQQPNGVFATVMSFIPPFTPMMMLLRQSLPGGVPWWQPWLGLVGTAACTVFITWAAARIFRIGILSQGKAPKVSELARWVIRG